MWGQSDNNQVNLTEPVVSEHDHEKCEITTAPRKRFDFIIILKLCQFSRGSGPGHPRRRRELALTGQAWGAGLPVVHGYARRPWRAADPGRWYQR